MRVWERESDTRKAKQPLFSASQFPNLKGIVAETNPQYFSTVTGYFFSEQKAEAALDALRSAGFSHNQVPIPLTEERVSIEKEPVVREEVRAGKKKATEVESRGEQVRREELRVEEEKQGKEERKRRAA